MEIGHIIPHIEALLFASDKPLTPIDVTELINNAFGFMEDKITMEQVQTAIEGIVEKYSAEFYPFELRESGGGWQFLTKKDYHKTVAQLNGDKYLKRLSGAALETLAIIAYKQPITKADIEAIRGVSCDYSIQKLLEKELIIISGRNEELPGKPLIYATSRTFMDYFGLNSPADLPKLKEVFNEALVDPTVMNNEMPAAAHNAEETTITEGEEDQENSLPLVVNEDGELLENLVEEVDESTEITSEESIPENEGSEDVESANEIADEPVAEESEEVSDDEDTFSDKDDQPGDEDEDASDVDEESKN
jgi:segregation and condensation protein B